MITTQFFILTQEQFDECSIEAEKLSVSIDYFLSEFCSVEGPTIHVANT